LTIFYAPRRNFALTFLNKIDPVKWFFKPSITGVSQLQVVMINFFTLLVMRQDDLSKLLMLVLSIKAKMTWKKKEMFLEELENKNRESSKGKQKHKLDKVDKVFIFIKSINGYFFLRILTQVLIRSNYEFILDFFLLTCPLRHSNALPCGLLRSCGQCYQQFFSENFPLEWKSKVVLLMKIFLQVFKTHRLFFFVVKFSEKNCW